MATTPETLTMIATVPIAYLRCVRPTLLPLPCRDGELVALWPRHPAHTHLRIDAEGRCLGHGWLPTEDLFDLARHLVLDGTLTPLTPDCAAQLFRPGRTSWRRAA